MVARESRARAGGQGGQGGQAGRGDGDGEQFEVRGTGEQGAVPTIVPGSRDRDSWAAGQLSLVDVLG